MPDQKKQNYASEIAHDLYVLMRDKVIYGSPIFIGFLLTIAWVVCVNVFVGLTRMMCHLDIVLASLCLYIPLETALVVRYILWPLRHQTGNATYSAHVLDTRKNNNAQ